MPGIARARTISSSTPTARAPVFHREHAANIPHYGTRRVGVAVNAATCHVSPVPSAELEFKFPCHFIAPVPCTRHVDERRIVFRSQGDLIADMFRLGRPRIRDDRHNTQDNPNARTVYFAPLAGLLAFQTYLHMRLAPEFHIDASKRCQACDRLHCYVCVEAKYADLLFGPGT
jgi:hypothetical protein